MRTRPDIPGRRMPLAFGNCATTGRVPVFSSTARPMFVNRPRKGYTLLSARVNSMRFSAARSTTLVVVDITPLLEAPAIVLGIMDLGGVVIPVIDIRKRFGHPSHDIR